MLLWQRAINLHKPRRDQLADLVLVGIAHHPLHALEGRHFLRRALRVAACHQDLRARILAVNAADCLARVAISFRSDRAGVEHHHVRRGGVLGPVQSAGR